jgi:hypothetical protein
VGYVYLVAKIRSKTVECTSRMSRFIPTKRHSSNAHSRCNLFIHSAVGNVDCMYFSGADEVRCVPRAVRRGGGGGVDAAAGSQPTAPPSSHRRRQRQTRRKISDQAVVADRVMRMRRDTSRDGCGRDASRVAERAPRSRCAQDERRARRCHQRRAGHAHHDRRVFAAACAATQAHRHPTRPGYGRARVRACGRAGGRAR